MGEFRIGRAYAKHSYPDPRRDTTVQFARNFAVGPELNTAIAKGDPTPPATGGTLVPWSAIESGAAPGTTVPITPLVTGIVRVSAVLSIKNASVTPQIAFVQILIDGFVNPIPELEAVTIPASGFMAIPILAEIPEFLTLNTTFNIAIRVFSLVDNNALSLAAESSTIDIAERPFATG